MLHWLIIFNTWVLSIFSTHGIEHMQAKAVTSSGGNRRQRAMNGEWSEVRKYKQRGHKFNVKEKEQRKHAQVKNI